MMPFVVGWIVVGLTCLVLELLLPGLLFFFACALATIFPVFFAWLGASFIIQMGMFLAGCFNFSLALYWLFGSRVKKEEHYKSAIDALPGKKGFVLKKISPQHIGQVDIKGEIWSAKALHNEVIEEGTSIEVICVEGVRLIVKVENKQ